MRVVGAETEQIGVACRAMRLAVPEGKEQRALEDELVGVLGDCQAIKHPFDAVAREDEVEVLLRRSRIDAARLAVMT